MISAIIVTLNRRNDLEDAVNSILTQKEVELELLLIDNGSTDTTADYAKQLTSRDPRVRYFSFEQNIGIPAAFNKGLSEGRGEVFFGFDDDQWLKDPLFLKKAIDTQHTQPWDLMSTRIINPDQKNEAFFTQRPKDDRNFYTGNFLNGSIFIKRHVVERIGLMEGAYFRQGQENEYAIRAILAGFNILYQRQLAAYHKRNPYRPNTKLVGYYALRNTLLKNYRYFQAWKLAFLNTWQISQFIARMLRGRITPFLLAKAMIDYQRMKSSTSRHMDYSREDMERFFFVSRKIVHSPEEIGRLGFWRYCLSGLERFL